MGIQTQPTIYRSCTPVVDTWYDVGSNRMVTEVIVEALAEAEGVDETELTPLYETIDLDALSALLENCAETDRDIIMGFKYETWNVFVRGDGRVRVCDTTREIEPEPVFGGRPA